MASATQQKAGFTVHEQASSGTAESSDSWWRGAAIYQLYVRSFADSDGDGIGDLAGVRAKLPYLGALGIDAIWFNPWYPSPMADAGYDISDYRSIDPVFGTLDEADALIGEAHALGIRIIVDIVPNHGSDRHPWFTAALAAGPGSAERSRFWFRPGRGADGSLPPNDWQSIFGGPAWSRVTSPDGTPGEWYLHLFAPGAARLQLVLARRPPGIRRRAALLVLPRCGRHQDRLGGAALQGSAAAGRRC